MCTSKNGKKSWKKELVQRWENLVSLYRKAKDSPSIRRWGKVLLAVGKIVLSVLLRKAIEYWLRDF